MLSCLLVPFFKHEISNVGHKNIVKSGNLLCRINHRGKGGSKVYEFLLLAKFKISALFLLKTIFQENNGLYFLENILIQGLCKIFTTPGADLEEKYFLLNVLLDL